jgi:sulfite reductase beta subunit-like hemoprotein
MSHLPPRSVHERLKASSRLLRGRLAELLAGSRGGATAEDLALLHFHGVWRCPAAEGAAEGGGERWGVRVRVPGGRLSPTQYLILEALAADHGDGSFRLTTRQGVQFQGIQWADLRPLIAELNHNQLTTLGAGGDVVRSVMVAPGPFRTPIQRRLEHEAYRLARHFLPRSRAYGELWLGEAPGSEASGPEVADSDGGGREPVYGPTYLPYGFRIGLATPEDAGGDLLANDLAAIGLFEAEALVGWNLTAGGGSGGGMPPSGLLGFIDSDELLPAAECLVRLFRDHGDRLNRQNGRFRRLVAERGEDWLVAELGAALGHALEPPRPMPEFAVLPSLGWHAQGDGRWSLGLPVRGGRIADQPGCLLRTALRRIVERYWAGLILTPDQNLIVTNLPDRDRAAIESGLRRFGVWLVDDLVPVEYGTVTCLGAPGCGRAEAGAELIRDRLVDQLVEVTARHGVIREPIGVRIAGCQAGCIRTRLGEIGIAGCGPGRYRVSVGGNTAGTRLGRVVAEDLPEPRIIEILETWIAGFARDRAPGERFGDYCWRVGMGDGI